MIAVLPFLLVSGASADVKLADIFQSGMVLQRGPDTRIYGSAPAGEKVLITVGSASASGRADKSGRFEIKLKTPKPGGPYVLRVKGEHGGSQEVRDVLVGDVWVCSGQSNMEWEANWFSGRRFEIGASDFPQIRLFKHAHRVSLRPETEALGSWTPSNVTSARNFSLVGFLFGREIHQKTGVPIGLIESAWGGTPAESWIDMPGLKGRPEFDGLVKKFDSSTVGGDAARTEFQSKVKDWTANVFLSTPLASEWAGSSVTASDWRTMKFPTEIEKQGLTMDGIIWFRRSVEVPASLAGKDLTLELGPIDDYDITYFNGQSVAHTGPATPNAYSTPRKYTIPGNLVKAGSNTIAIRVWDTGGGGGGSAEPDAVRVGNGTTWIPLAGDWQGRIEADFADQALLKKMAPPAAPVGLDDPWLPTGLYNGMIASLIPFNVRGAIWYQGESNVGRAAEYSLLFPDMIQSWRRTWKNPNLDFYFVQLAAYGPIQDSTTDSGWAELRESQTAALKLKGTGMAVAIDAGEANDIHPIRKDLVGHRLAVAALAKTYGQKVQYLGPTPKSIQSKDGALHLPMDHAKGLKSLDGAALRGFAVAGTDGKFFVAEAKIEGEKLVVSSKDVPKPMHVRYAWADYINANLGNGENLPAAPFRLSVK